MLNYAGLRACLKLSVYYDENQGTLLPLERVILLHIAAITGKCISPVDLSHYLQYWRCSNKDIITLSNHGNTTLYLDI